jgi:inner membrane transporter RhtA
LKPTRVLPLALLLTAMLSIQFGASLAKNLFTDLGPAAMTALRVSFAALFLLAFNRPWRTKLPAGSFKWVLAYGVALGLMNLLFYFSLAKISLGVAVALEFTGPLTLAFAFSRRKLDVLWALLAGAGIIFVLPTTDWSKGLELSGTLLALGAGAFWAVYILIGRKISVLMPPTVAASWGMCAAALTVLPLGFVYDPHHVLAFSFWPMAFGVAILSSALPYSLEMKVMSQIPTKTFGVLMSLEPAVAALMGFLFLSEHLDLLQSIGIALVIAASAGTSLTHSEVSKLQSEPNPVN